MKLLLIILLAVCSLIISKNGIAQTGTLTVANGTLLNVGDSCTVSTELTIQNNGQIQNSDSSLWIFNGTTAQTLNGNSIMFGKLLLDNTAGLFLNNHQTIQSEFAFSNGKVALNNFDCIFKTNARIKNASAYKYFITNGSGNLLQSIDNNATINFPVGTSNSYLPYIFANNGTADVYSIRVDEGSYLNYNATSGTGTGSAVSNLAINKTWIINEGTPGGSNFDLTLQWNATNELSGFNRNQAEVRYFDYPTASWKTASAYLAANGTDPYHLTKTISGIANLKNFPIGIFTLGAPLPLQWIAFGAKATNDDAMLNWSVAAQSGNNYFTIQRSANGVKFTDVAKIPAKLATQYNYTNVGIISICNASNQPIIYYRLQQTDVSGASSYSQTIALNTQYQSSELAVKAYPNPVVDALHVQLQSTKNETVGMQLTNSEGRILQQTSVVVKRGINEVFFSMQPYAAGMYTLSFFSSNMRKNTTIYKK